MRGRVLRFAEILGGCPAIQQSRIRHEAQDNSSMHEERKAHHPKLALLQYCLRKHRTALLPCLRLRVPPARYVPTFSHHRLPSKPQHIALSMSSLVAKGFAK